MSEMPKPEGYSKKVSKTTKKKAVKKKEVQLETAGYVRRKHSIKLSLEAATKLKSMLKDYDNNLNKLDDLLNKLIMEK